MSLKKPLVAGSAGLSSAAATAGPNYRPLVKEAQRQERKKLAVKMMKAILMGPNKPATEKEIAEMAVSCVDSLLHTLHVSEVAKDRMANENRLNALNGLVV